MIQSAIRKFLLPAVAVCFLLPFTLAEAQDRPAVPRAEETAEVPSAAFAGLEEDATLSVEEFRADTARAIMDAAERSETLSRGEKRRIQRVMRGGWFQEARKNRIIDAVAQRMHAEQLIAVTPAGVEAAIDWDSILAFIEKLIPLIIQLIGLFGG